MLGTKISVSARRAMFALSILSMATSPSLYAQPEPPSAGQPERWVVDDISGTSTEDLYAKRIAPAVFDRSSHKVIDGYTVESGNLRSPDKSDGSLVTVRSPDGSLTALINKAGVRGILNVDSKGAGRFTPEPASDATIEDGVVNPDDKIATAPVDSNAVEPKVVDLLMGYSKAAVERVGGDVNADALAKVELVNLMLRNSLVSNVSFKLVGVQVIDQDHAITTETLGKVPTLFADGIARFEPDVTYGNFVTILPGGAVGWGYVPGRTSIGAAHSPSTFAHELGHNAGSSHCNDQGLNDYRFGYFNGKTRSILCQGTSSTYYSTPLVKDEFGLPRGHAVTADTARVWRENAERLSSYSHFTPKAPVDFRLLWSGYDSVKFNWTLSPRAVKYEIWMKPSILLPVRKVGESTTTEGVVLNAPQGFREYHVVALFNDGSASARSNVVYAKPYENSPETK